MRISRVDSVRYSIPFETGGPQIGMRPSLNARPWVAMEGLLVRVETEDGRFGWGEAFGHLANPGTDAILRDLVGPWFVGRNAAEITATMEEAQRAFHGLGRSGPVLYALSALDIALWDLAGKRAGCPVFQLLGGSGRDLDLYASLMRYGGNAEAIARNVKRAVDAGYGWIKLHEATVPAFRAARSAVAPETRIMLDVNCPWAVDEARAIAAEIAADDFHWLEEPVWPPEDFDGIAQVRLEGVPVAAGENVGTLHEFKRLFEAEAVDFVQPSVTKIGGITAMRRVVALAEAYGVRVVPHCFYWGPGYLATAHVIAAMARPCPLETAFITLAAPPHPLWNPEAAHLMLPDVPGLGFQPDEAVLERFRVTG